MTEQEHLALHQRLHESLDKLIADFLRHNPRKLPSDTSVMELMEWSYQQTVEPTEWR